MNNELVKIADQKVSPLPSSKRAEPKTIDGKFFLVYSWLDVVAKPLGEMNVNRLDLIVLFLVGCACGILATLTITNF